MHWAAGRLRVCVVAPTGSGKTELAVALLGTGRALWVAHTRDLVLQTARRLRALLGQSAVGVILAGHYPDSSARIQVGTVQTLVARGLRPGADVIVLDEAHHYMAEHWRQLADAYPGIPCVGLTATPQRGDGEPLGDIFDELVSTASYSQLIAGGFLVPARVLQPPMQLGNDLAQEPVTAWEKYSEGSRTFLFCPRVEIAEFYAKAFRDRGILFGVIEANTPRVEREELLARFRTGALRGLANVNTLTEGIDVPEARCVMLARGFGHVGAYLQAVGRVLRPAKDKADAIVIDLCGATLRHGLPTQDRVYSLQGRPISGEAPEREQGERDAFSQNVRGLDLKIAAGAAPIPFGLPPPVDDSERRAEFERLRALARQHRMRDGFAAAKFKEKFGEWPKEEWT